MVWKLVFTFKLKNIVSCIINFEKIIFYTRKQIYIETRQNFSFLIIEADQIAFVDSKANLIAFNRSFLPGRNFKTILDLSNFESILDYEDNKVDKILLDNGGSFGRFAMISPKKIIDLSEGKIFNLEKANFDFDSMTEIDDFHHKVEFSWPQGGLVKYNFTKKFNYFVIEKILDQFFLINQISLEKSLIRYSLRMDIFCKTSARLIQVDNLVVNLSTKHYVYGRLGVHRGVLTLVSTWGDGLTVYKYF